jgi:hypothetical protein
MEAAYDIFIQSSTLQLRIADLGLWIENTIALDPATKIRNPQSTIEMTLKRGFWNHDRFCRGVLAVENALVRSRLFETSSGIPVLQVPEEDILAVGTTNPLADVATCLHAETHRQAQAHVTARLFNPQSAIRNPQYEGAPWGRMYGELLTFDDPDAPARHRPPGGIPPGRLQPLQTSSRAGM